MNLKFEKSWNDFQAFLGNFEKRPSTEDYIQYLEHLQHIEGTNNDRTFKVCIAYLKINIL